VVGDVAADQDRVDAGQPVHVRHDPLGPFVPLGAAVQMQVADLDQQHQPAMSTKRE
jgi:hypothetical protein